MKKWKIVTGILLIFCIGIYIGAVGTHLFLRHQVIAVFKEGPPAFHRLIIKRLTQQLELSPKQQTLISQKITATQQRMLALRSRYQPEATAIINDGVREMQKDLTPSQQKKLHQLYQEMSQRLSPYHTP